MRYTSKQPRDTIARLKDKTFPDNHTCVCALTQLSSPCPISGAHATMSSVATLFSASRGAPVRLRGLEFSLPTLPQEYGWSFWGVFSALIRCIDVRSCILFSESLVSALSQLLIVTHLT